MHQLSREEKQIRCAEKCYVLISFFTSCFFNKAGFRECLQFHIDVNYSVHRFLALEYDVEEPSETAVIVRRQGPTDQSVTLHYVTVDGTANSEQGDYTRVVDQTLTFGIGQVEQTIYVRVLDDTTAEGPETFFLEVYKIDGGFY